jgi:hypothetical protein
MDAGRSRVARPKTPDAPCQLKPILDIVAHTSDLGGVEQTGAAGRALTVAYPAVRMSRNRVGMSLNTPNAENVALAPGSRTITASCGSSTRAAAPGGAMVRAKAEPESRLWSKSQSWAEDQLRAKGVLVGTIASIQREYMAAKNPKPRVSRMAMRLMLQMACENRVRSPHVARAGF